MSIDEDRKVDGTQDTVVRETSEGYRVLGAPEKSVTHQHDIGRISEKFITQEMLNESGQNPEAWLVYGGNYEQHRHTTCELITPENVTDLELKYELPVGSGSSMEGTPLIVPGDPPIMYQSNGPNHLKAIDAREGDVLWSYVYAVPDDVLFCCSDSTRGPAVYGDKVFMTTLDSGVVALDRYSGEEQWYHSTADHERGYSATWAPIVYDGILYTGSAGGEYGVRGFHTAIDTETGDEVWTTLISPKEEWVGDSINQSGATNWTTASIDYKNGRIYLPTGNPGPVFDGSVRPGPNRNSCGTLCLDLKTGEQEWFHQESAHDIWDYDSAMPRIVIHDVKIRNKHRDVVVSVGKTGWLYTVDAETGELLVRSEPGCQQLNMFRMIPHIDEGRRMPFMPGSMGGNNWQPGSYNPKLGITYHKLNNSPQEAWWRFEEFEQGKKYWGGILEDETEAVPDGYNNHISVITAFNPFTGEIIWQDWIDSSLYLWGGTMTTATGLMFAGTQNGNLVAYDGKTGDHLWEYDVGAVPVSGDPVSWYDPVTEEQNIAVQVGGSGWLRSGKRDTRILVFSLKNGVMADPISENNTTNPNNMTDNIHIEIGIESRPEEDSISSGDIGFFFYNLNALYSAVQETMSDNDRFRSEVNNIIDEIHNGNTDIDPEFSELLDEYGIISDVKRDTEYYARSSEYYIEIESLRTENPVKADFSADQSFYLILREIYLKMGKKVTEYFEMVEKEEEDIMFESTETEHIDELNDSIDDILNENSKDYPNR